MIALDRRRYRALAVLIGTLVCAVTARADPFERGGSSPFSESCKSLGPEEHAFMNERHEQCLAQYRSRGGSVRPRHGKNCVYAACEQFHGCDSADSAESAAGSTGSTRGASSNLPPPSAMSAALTQPGAVASRLRQLPMMRQCERQVDDYSSCSAFVSEALQRVYGISDFKVDPGSRRFPDLVANDISTYVETHTLEWQRIGRADNQAALEQAQRLANEGYAVIAVHAKPGNGHVALIIPGELQTSSYGGLKMPNSASMFLNKPDRTYIGGRLSRAFLASDIDEVRMYFRAPGERGQP